ncbi:Uma2 family endonuclease [Streptomyces sp. BR1]|uniref:Uma2 family endonuclease n=1 Tax=Streptomyces sp. BR1 TaxID=1592323 RepID=UPI00402BDD4A
MGATMTAEPAHDWSRPPLDGYTVDDLLTLPDLPRHTELIDGSLVFVSAQRLFRSAVIDLLVSAIRPVLPEELRIAREMTVVLDRRNGPEPDICVVRADSVKSLDQTSFAASDLLLAVEVVSPESESRDRDTKPHKYAAAGIPHFWRVEKVGKDEVLAHVYELDPVTRRYVHAGIHRNRLKVGAPFDADIDLTRVRHF